MILKSYCVQLAAFSVLIVWACVAEAAEYAVYTVEPAITNRPIVAGKPLPAVCKRGDVLEVSACRGEYEPASFVIVTEKPLEAVCVEVSALTGPGGELAHDAVDVRIAKQWVWEDYVYNLLPPLMVLVKDDAMLVEKAVPTEADANARRMTAPNGLRDSETLQPANIAGLKQYWLTVHVPEDAEPGVYGATVNIIPANAPPAELTLRLKVHSFTLLPPRQEYSLYYPVTIVAERSEDWRTGRWTNMAWLTPEQYLLELSNMIAHGVTNPNIYTGVGRNEDGTLDFSRLERVLALREQAGIGPGVPLYKMSAAGEPEARALSREEKSRVTNEVRQVMAWCKQRGYDDVYWAALDEAGGERLRAERDSFQAIHAGGGKVFAACSADFYDIVGELMDRPVLHCDYLGAPLDQLMESLSLDHPRMLPLDARAARAEAKARLRADFEQMVSEIPERGSHIHKIIDGTHRRGNKIFAYAFPWSAWQLPATHRHHYGLGLWKMGLDGSMNWAYTHIKGDLGPDPINQGFWGYVIRTQDGVLDKLQWEGFREGVDDARYLATLKDAIKAAESAGKPSDLIAETKNWMDALEVDANLDLDAVRREMARRIEELLK